MGRPARSRCGLPLVRTRKWGPISSTAASKVVISTLFFYPDFQVDLILLIAVSKTLSLP